MEVCEGLPDCPKGFSEELPKGFEDLSEESEGLPEGAEGLSEGPEGLLGGPWGRMDGHMDGRTELLPILQDFVLCWGSSPKRTN